MPRPNPNSPPPGSIRSNPLPPLPATNSFEPPKETPTVEAVGLTVQPGTDFIVEAPVKIDGPIPSGVDPAQSIQFIPLPKGDTVVFGGDPGPGYIQPPSLGRIVIFIPDEDDLLCKQNGAERLPAIVTRVNDNGTVNLKIFCDWMNNQWRPDVPFSPSEDMFSWHWPPRV